MKTVGQMPLFAIESEPGLQHLAIEREPEISGERRRKEPPPPPPRVIGRGPHGVQVAGSVQGALEQVQATRAAHGIAPDRLLVLGFRSWDSGVREILEGRLGGTVVDEQVETRNVQCRLVQLPPSQTMEAFNSSLATYLASADQAHEQLRIRAASDDDIKKAAKVAPQLAKADVTQLVVLERTAWPESVEHALRSASAQQLAKLPEKREHVASVLVQFPTKENIESFRKELDRYTNGNSDVGVIPLAARQRFFDSLEWSGARRCGCQTPNCGCQTPNGGKPWTGGQAESRGAQIGRETDRCGPASAVASASRTAGRRDGAPVRSVMAPRG